MPSTYRRPGSFVQETTLSQRIITQNNGEFAGAFAGITERGRTDVPVYVTSWSEYSNAFGGLNSISGSSLPLANAVYQFFSNGGRNCYVKRVVGAGAAAANLTLTDKTESNNVLKISAFGQGSWGNSVYVYTENTTPQITVTAYSTTGTAVTLTTSTPHGLVATDKIFVNMLNSNQSGINGSRTLTGATSTTLTFSSTASLSGTVTSGSVISPIPETFNLYVYYQGSSENYLKERFFDLTMDPTSDRYALDYVNASSSWVVLSLPTSYSNPDLRAPKTPDSGTASALAGSSLDGSAVGETELSAATTSFDEVLQNLVFNIPDATSLSSSDHSNVTAAYMTYADERDDSFVIVDTPASLDTVGALSWITGLPAKTGNAAAYYPWIKVPNPSARGTAAIKTMPPGGSVLGLMLSSDSVNNVWKAPAGIRAVLRNVVATESNLTSANLDSLNSSTYPINAIRPVPGAGICVMGARTLSGSRTDRYVNSRRTLLQIKKRLIDLTSFAVFENNSRYLWNQVQTVCAVYLNEVWQGGGLKGVNAQDAYYVICDETNNPDASIDEGELNVEVGVALQTPAEFVVIKIGQFQGSTTVRVEG
jgi:phage tail sheath protein FI